MQANRKIMAKKVACLSFCILFLMGLFYYSIIPEIVSAVSTTGTATPTLAVNTELNVTSPGSVSLTPSIGGLTGNYGNPASGTVTFTVTSNSSTGFNLKLHASQVHALYRGAAATQYFGDYTPVAGLGNTPDYAWQSPASYTAWFGFSVGADTAANAYQPYRSDGASKCNQTATTNNSTSNCFQGFNSTTDYTVVSTSTTGGAAGQAENIRFLAEFNNPALGTGLLENGTYTATITATVAAN